MIRTFFLLTTVCPTLFGTVFQYTEIDYPGASATFANAINNAGQIVGTYRDGSGLAHGFLLQNGVYSAFNFPGSAETYVNGINARGDIVGWNTTASFLYSGGAFSTFNVPGSTRTTAIDVNSSDVIVGGFIDSAGANHGFQYNGGVFIPIDVPGAVSTGAYGINDSGVIAGQAPSVAYGFLLTNGSVMPIPNFPGSLGTLSATDINNAGAIIGQYAYAGGGFFANSGGYLFRNGSFDSVIYPGSTFVRPNGLNDLNVIVGDFADATGSHGFVATPIPEPASALLFVAGGVLLFACAARRKLRLFRFAPPLLEQRLKVIQNLRMAMPQIGFLTRIRAQI